MISYEGIDEAELIHALHHGTRAQGMGVLHNRPSLTVEDVRAEPAERPAHVRYSFDYYHGRPLKVRLDTDAKEFDPRLYDRDAGTGTAQQVVDRLRAKAA